MRRTALPLALLTAGLATLALSAAAQQPYTPPPPPGRSYAPPPPDRSYAPSPPADRSYTPPPADESDASPGPGQGYGPPGPPTPAMIDQNLSNLHNRLMLAPNQEPAWRAFFDAMHQQAQQMQAASSRMAAQVSSTAPERFTQMAQVMQQGASSMNGVARALASLYATLNASQRATIESEFPAQGGARPTPGMAGGGPPLR